MTELAELIRMWSHAHLSAEEQLLKQIARVCGELTALERTVRAWQERHRSELAALLEKLDMS